MAKRIKYYTLYTNGYNITNQTKEYRSGMWVCEVKALGIKQAYFFVKNKIAYNEKGGLGIISVDNSFGPGQKEWIWPDELYPKHWKQKNQEDFDPILGEKGE